MNRETNCCGPTCCTDQAPGAEAPAAGDARAITDAVRNRYGAVATAGLSSGRDGVRAVAEAFGYTPDELASIPAEANMALSCGNPIALASLKPGEVVVDLGSGGGLDVFLAARKVGPTGRAIGIDMTPQMIELARRNAIKAGATNVEFHHATIDHLPLVDASADVVISNCVINLAPDKRAVFREIARVLKPGGRVAISDIVLTKPLPADVAGHEGAFCGCVAGAISVDDYRAGLAEAGLAHVTVRPTGADLSAYAKVEGTSSSCGCAPPAPAGKGTTASLPLSKTGCCGSEVHDGIIDVLAKYDVNDFAASVNVMAVRDR